jgi:hypothetical protein
MFQGTVGRIGGFREIDSGLRAMTAAHHNPAWQLGIGFLIISAASTICTENPVMARA